MSATADQPIAAIDIGTNSVHLVIARPTANGSPEILTREKAPVRLGSGGRDMKRLDPAASDRAIDALGRFRLHGDVHRVDICVVEQPLILHELAHAWEHHFVTDATREAFMAATDAPSWEDPNHAHKARGIEKAAYLVAWALEDAPLQRFSAGLYMDDLANYELLTGSPSPRIAHWADEEPVPTRDALADVELVADASFG